MTAPHMESILVELATAIQELRLELQAKAITPRRTWYPADEAVELLGYTSHRQLWEAVDSGLLRLGKGKEVSDRRKPGAKRPLYYFHIPRCLERLEQLPGERKP